MSSKLGIVANNQGNSGKVIIKGKRVGVRPTYLKRGKSKLKSVAIQGESSFRKSVSGPIIGKAQLINRIGEIVKSNEGALISLRNRHNIEQLFSTLD